MRQKLIRLLRERSFVSARDAADYLNMPVVRFVSLRERIGVDNRCTEGD